MRPVEPSADWDSLPPALRIAIETRVGKVKGSSPAGEGLSTSIRLILHSESGDVFVKGTGPDSTDHQRGRLALGGPRAIRDGGLAPAAVARRPDRRLGRHRMARASGPPVGRSEAGLRGHPEDHRSPGAAVADTRAAHPDAHRSRVLGAVRRRPRRILRQRYRPPRPREHAPRF
jgi:hypothetical protein